MKFGLLGEELSYSLSEKIHKLIYDKLNLNHSYENIEISKDKLNYFINNISTQFNGYNVTIPYKEDIIEYLHEVSPKAAEINSVNVVLNKKNKLYGYNTDIDGFSCLMKKNQIDFKDKDIVILGTGATAITVNKYAIDNDARSISFVSRRNKNKSITYGDYINGDILVNTTPIGMINNEDKSPVDEDTVKNFNVIIDINYNPYRTKLLRYGIYNNKQVISGLYMLVAQAVKSYKYFCNIELGNEFIDDIYNSLTNSYNITLVGLMGSGKTTIGKSLAKKLDKKFVDIDEEIIEVTGKTINELFDDSEESFRKVESDIINKYANKNNYVISTGGGVIKNESNIDSLYTNSQLILINRDIDKIIDKIDAYSRPLIKNDIKYNLYRIYKERQEIYEKYCEHEIINNSTIELAVNDIINIWENKR